MIHGRALVFATLGTLGCGSTAAQAPAASQTGPEPEGVQAEPDARGEPSDAVAEDLVALREEEKLARDVYLTLLDRWGIRAFENISGSEQRHMDRVGALLTDLAIPDPVTDDAIGSFTSERFAGLYAELVERGLRSEREALEVGALIEDLDIADIDSMLTRTDDPAVRQTYELLRCGSRNHLRAFTGLLADRGVQYSPQHLDDETYRSIVEGEHERCGRLYGGGGGHGGRGHRRGHGRGRGRGHGAGHGGGHGGGHGRGHGGGW